MRIRLLAELSITKNKFLSVTVSLPTETLSSSKILHNYAQKSPLTASDAVFGSHPWMPPDK